MPAWTFGDTLEGLAVDGRRVRAAVFNEHQVRAAAGITLLLGAVAFVYAYFAKVYLPIKFVTAIFFLEFAVRLLAGIRVSPVGLIAGWMTQRQAPHWVSAKPKRFAWTLGLVMSAAMTLITQADIRGALPLSICLVCMTLMWLESVLGLCLGCEVHGVLVRRGWAAKDEAFEVCSHAACAVRPQT
jgi:Domain of unknown function (DUF4395)